MPKDATTTETTDSASDFKITVSAKRNVFDLHLRETLQYKDLIFLFVKRNFVANYKQTILGPLWAIVQPLLTTVVFTIVFGNLAGLTTADTEGAYKIPSFLFYMCGNICWAYFSATLLSTSSTFLSNSGIMGKVYFPRLVVPVSTSLSKLISFGIQLAMLIGFWLYFLFSGTTDICIRPTILLLPLCILQMMLPSIGFGIIFSSLTAKYRDLQMLLGFGLSLWQYASPIAYGLSLVPAQYLGLYMLNPMTPIVTTFRYALFGFGYFDLSYYLLSWAISILVFVVGLFMFSRVERVFMDTI